MYSDILSTLIKMSSMLPCPCIHILCSVTVQHFQSRGTVHFSALESRLEFWFVWTVKCYYARSEPKPHVALYTSTHFELPFQQPRFSCSVMANKVEQRWAILAEAIRDQPVPSQLESWLQWAQLRAKRATRQDTASIAGTQNVSWINGFSFKPLSFRVAWYTTKFAYIYSVLLPFYLLEFRFFLKAMGKWGWC